MAKKEDEIKISSWKLCMVNRDVRKSTRQYQVKWDDSYSR